MSFLAQKTVGGVQIFEFKTILRPLGHSSKSGAQNEILVHKFFGHDKMMISEQVRILAQKLWEEFNFSILGHLGKFRVTAQKPGPESKI